MEKKNKKTIKIKHAPGSLSSFQTPSPEMSLLNPASNSLILLKIIHVRCLLQKLNEASRCYGICSLFIVCQQEEEEEEQEGFSEGSLWPLSFFANKSIEGNLTEVAGEKLTLGFSLIHIMSNTKQFNR